MQMNPRLLTKYQENTATDAEMEQVLDWLDADPAHRRELDERDKVFAASAVHGTRLLHRMQKSESRRGAVRRIVRYALEAAAVVAVGFGLSQAMMEQRIGEWAQRTTTLEVPAGHFMSMKLQDGTTVWLNSGTKLEYPLVFAKGERRVKVEGEAMFDVEHDPAHPFVVETFACDVEVLGTKFDVVAEQTNNIFSTALLRGSVKVTSRLAAREQVVLRPNEEVRLVGGHLSLDRINDPEGYLWTEGKISIKGLSFAELMRKFEKSFGVKITIEREQMPALNYNHGKIRISDGVDSALRLLQMAGNFTYTRNEEDGTIVIR